MIGSRTDRGAGMGRSDGERRFVALARRQHGVITRGQAMSGGLTDAQIRWRLERGDWRVLHRGVYLTHTGELTWAARASAGLLWCGEDSALVLDAAAHMWRVAPEAPRLITIGVPSARRIQNSTDIQVVRRARLDLVRVNGLSTVRMAQTIVDLADDPRRALGEVIALAARAGQQGRVTGQALLAELASRTRHCRRRELELLLSEIGAGAESLPEVLFATRVMRPHGLPDMERQVRHDDERTRTDLEARPYGVRVEVDGRTWHAGEAFHTDRRRDRRTAAAGEVTLRVTPREIGLQPCALALDVGAVLRQRGWAGRFTACSPTCGAVQQNVALGPERASRDSKNLPR